MLYELIYRSLGFKEMDTDELDDLLKFSNTSNQAHGITGMLLYHNQEFLQVLEGEQDDVRSLYHRIVADDRHHLAHVIQEGTIEERGFGQWTMGFVDTRNTRLNVSENYTNFLKDGILTASRKNPTICKQLLEYLRDAFLPASTISLY